MEMGGGGDRLPGGVVDAVGGVGAHDVERRAVAVGPDREHARRRLDLGAPDEHGRVHIRLLEQLAQHVARRVGADGAGAAHPRAQLGQHQRRPAGRARGGDADLLDQLAALALGYPVHRPHQHVEHVHSHGDRVHLLGHPRSSSSMGWVVP